MKGFLTGLGITIKAFAVTAMISSTAGCITGPDFPGWFTELDPDAEQQQGIAGSPDDNVGTDTESDPDPAGVSSTAAISGTVFAPNGSDPIANALVYIPQNTQSGASFLRPMSHDPDTCGDAPEPAMAHTCTAADGSFRLGTVPEGEIEVIISKGLFQISVTVHVIRGQDAALPSTDTTLSTEDSDTSRAPKIVVSTGAYDSIQHVLARLGFADTDNGGALIPGSESFELISGYSAPEDPYDLYDFLSSPDVADADLIIINCGHNIAAELIFDELLPARIRDYVSGGGRLYVTDLSYDVIEAAFPEVIDFYGLPDTPSTEVETGFFMVISTAMVGQGGITSAATPLIDGLGNWLGLLESCVSLEGEQLEHCIEPDGTLEIGDFAGGWAVMKAPHPDFADQVDIWVEGPVRYSDIEADGYSSTSSEPAPYVTEVRPLTITFPFGKGKVFYSSYHTSGGPHAGFTAQERVLQYLLFEVVD